MIDFKSVKVIAADLVP